MKQFVLYRKKTALAAVFFLIAVFCLLGIRQWVTPLPLGGNDQIRREFLFSCGIETGRCSSRPVTVPAFSAEYLAFQQEQGFFPEEYLNSSAELYCFEVINLPGNSGKFYANLLICDGFIIAGEIYEESDPNKLRKIRFNR